MMVTSAMLAPLRDIVRARLSEKRFVHTLGVEECAAELAQMYLPEDELPAVRAAALLHDITKEYTPQEHRALLSAAGQLPRGAEVQATALFHARTAPLVIQRDFPAYADPAVLSAVRRHTEGAQDMSTFDKIIFLADYIEPNRTYSSCVAVRDFLYTSLSEGEEDPARVLDMAVQKELDFTLIALIRKGVYVSPCTLQARNSILGELFPV